MKSDTSCHQGLRISHTIFVADVNITNFDLEIMIVCRKKKGMEGERERERE